MLRDRLGRARTPGQSRGLRPLHPRLPIRWVSRALRLAMPQSDWARFDSLAHRHRGVADTQARAYGQTIVALMNANSQEAAAAPLDWLEWERRKSLRLLPRVH